MDKETESFFEIDRLLRGARPRGRGRGVLVVDDEPAICLMVQEILTPLGYAVQAVNTGQEALRIVKESGASIGLVLIDVVMPSMDGLSVLATMRRLDPALSFALVSGRLNEDTRWLASERGCRFLSKPFNVSELGQLALDVLGPGERAAT